jgi:hypothetical protein
MTEEANLQSIICVQCCGMSTDLISEKLTIQRGVDSDRGIHKCPSITDGLCVFGLGDNFGLLQRGTTDGIFYGEVAIPLRTGAWHY